MHDTHRIVVIGGGYTGMFSAIRLARRTRRLDVRITLVNPSSRFTERLRMRQVAAGQRLADHRIPDLLAGTGFTFVQGAATTIDTDARRVVVDGGAATLDYDILVYVIGSSTDTGKVPGTDIHAFTLDGLQIADRFATRLAEVAKADGAVTVCDGGLTGTGWRCWATSVHAKSTKWTKRRSYSCFKSGSSTFRKLVPKHRNDWGTYGSSTNGRIRDRDSGGECHFDNGGCHTGSRSTGALHRQGWGQRLSRMGLWRDRLVLRRGHLP
ncbi:FAD-dependent oxidoreductase [Streptosporangium sp. NPDC048865]|uniref:FAD-dependent oxidoreductase n=1 Tax=Streptosporangium sp. NPDC048865 TaxID=3155766 RepID=UPI003446A0E4